MCGFAGVLFAPDSTTPVDERGPLAQRMAAAVARRGPDGDGVWVDSAARLAFAHRRLAVIDLSENGHQPMISACDRFAIAYNGEIYNFRELRGELENLGHVFRGSSDTEVLLAALVQWGIPGGVQRINGMFALALWDRRERTLHLARDRVGKKPLVYGRAGRDFVFGSDLHTLRMHPEFKSEIHRDAVAQFLRLTYVPCPLTIYRDVFKLRPASVLTIDANDIGGSLTAPRGPRAYWSAAEVAERGGRQPFDGSDDEATDEFERILRGATAERMVSDVPFGAFLSGGLDSSIVVSMMQANSSRKIKTYTLGFGDRSEETANARRIAAHLGTDHTEFQVQDAEVLETVERMPSIFDEPFADSSSMPTSIICTLARQHVTVALTGDGGDELLFGYRRYFRALKIQAALRRTPKALLWLLRTAGRGLRAGTKREGRVHRALQDLYPEAWQEHYLTRISRWRRPSDVVIGATEPALSIPDIDVVGALPDQGKRMSLVDFLTYLPDDVLTKVDRASMDVGLEVRSPLLDTRMVEFALDLPMSMLFRENTSKWVLRRALERYIPRELTELPKTGFGSPVRAWLAGPLRGWADELLSPERLRGEGILRPEIVGRMWAEHRSGKRKWHRQLWPVLVFQAWWEHARRAPLAREGLGNPAIHG